MGTVLPDIGAFDRKLNTYQAALRQTIDIAKSTGDWDRALAWLRIQRLTDGMNKVCRPLIDFGFKHQDALEVIQSRDSDPQAKVLFDLITITVRIPQIQALLIQPTVCVTGSSARQTGQTLLVCQTQGPIGAVHNERTLILLPFRIVFFGQLALS